MTIATRQLTLKIWKAFSTSLHLWFCIRITITMTQAYCAHIHTYDVTPTLEHRQQSPSSNLSLTACYSMTSYRQDCTLFTLLLFCMSILYAYIVTVYFAFDKVLLKNFTTTTTTTTIHEEKFFRQAIARQVEILGTQWDLDRCRLNQKTRSVYFNARSKTNVENR